jgi:DNA-binding LacI/PurR family transcriptional regulator
MTKTSKPRLADVARSAGVSLGTASNVFCYPAKVRPELRERVMASVELLGYSGPDPAARLMRAGKVNSIGIVAPARFGVVDTLRNSSFLLFMQGVAEVCDAKGSNLVILPDPADTGAIHSALVDGLIFGQVEQLAVIEPARLRRLPFAVVDVDAGPGINSVRVDAYGGGYAAARHLLDQGHRKFGIMGFLREFGLARYHPPGPARDSSIAGMPIDQEKLRGYAAALAENGLSVDDIPIVQSHPWDKAAAAALLDRAHEATAILSMSAMQAIEIMTVAQHRGLAVPEDLSVVGFNDIPEAALTTPPLTVVDARNTEKGQIAAEMIFRQAPARAELLSPRLIVRASSGPAPGSENRPQ